MSASRRARFSSRRQRFARASTAEVMRLIVSPHERPRWQPEIVAMEGPDLLARGDVQEGRARMLGFDVDGKSTALVVERDRFEEDVIVGVRMRVSYKVEPAPDGVLIKHDVHAELPGGPMGTLLSVFLRRRLKKMQDEALRRLAVQAEASGAG